MTDLNTRIAELREAVSKMTPGEWQKLGAGGIKMDGIRDAYRITWNNPDAGGPYVADMRHHDRVQRLHDTDGIVALRNHAMSIIDEQQREIASLIADVRTYQGIVAEQAAEIERLRARVAELELTDTQVRSACLSYRHDYGLMDAKARGILEFQCREWWRAIRKEFEQPSKHPMVLSTKPQPPADTARGGK
jgi:hypothetical protein